jgi:hypothetical protein
MLSVLPRCYGCQTSVTVRDDFFKTLQKLEGHSLSPVIDAQIQDNNIHYSKLWRLLNTGGAEWKYNPTCKISSRFLDMSP